MKSNINRCPRPHGLSASESLEWIGWTESDDCWLWNGATDHSGYGKIHFGGKFIGTHRLAYTAWNGPIPEGMWVLHSCDRGHDGCINPAHLLLGDAKQNTRDCWTRNRNRNPVGESNAAAKLTDAQVEEIRRLRRDEGLLYRELAAMFGCSVSNIYCVVKEKSRMRRASETHGTASGPL